MRAINVQELMSTEGISTSQAFEIIAVLKPEVIYFPAGRYLVDRGLTIPAETKTVYGDGVGATTLVADPSTAQSIIDIAILFAPRGEIVDVEAKFSESPLRFDKQLQFDNLEDFRKHVNSEDILILEDPEENSYADMNLPGIQSRNYHAGEMVQVSNVSSTEQTIDIINGVQADYRRNSLRLGRMPRSRPLAIRDLSIIGTERVSTKERGLLVENGRNVVIERVHVKGSFVTLCELSHCVDCVVDRIIADQTSMYSKIDGVTLGQQYGLAISNCQNVTVTGSTLVGIRHGLTLGGSPERWDIVNRQICISNCQVSTLKSDSTAAIDAHGNAEYYTFHDNYVFGPISVAGQYGRILNNQIFSKYSGIQCNELKSLEHEIKGNAIHCRSEPGEKTEKKKDNGETETTQHHHGAILVALYHYTNQGSGPLIISNNRIIIDQSDGTAVTIFNQSSNHLAEVVFVDNYVFCSIIATITPKPETPPGPVIFIRVVQNGIRKLTARRNILRNCSDAPPLGVLVYLHSDNDCEVT